MIHKQIINHLIKTISKIKVNLVV